MPASFDKKYGQWRYRKRIDLPNGRRVRIKGTPDTNTKKAAEHAELLHILRLQNPTASPPETARLSEREEVPTIEEYVRPFLEGDSAADKPGGLTGKRRILAAYLVPALGSRAVDDLTQEDVDRVRAALLSGKFTRWVDGFVPRSRSGKPRSRKTVNNILTVLSSLLQYAAANKRRPSVELTFVIEEDEAELVALRSDEVEALLAATRDPRYRVAILLGADAGLRIGEIRGLEWDCVDELRRRIIVARSIDPANNHGSPKNRKRREVPATARLWQALRELPRNSRAVVSGPSGDPLGYYTMREGLLGIYEKAGVEVPPKPWHCLRHTFCTELARRKVRVDVIRRLAGHQSITTTLKYMHTSESELDGAIASLHASGPELGPRTQNNLNESEKL